jgi:hypothetical protein
MGHGYSGVFFFVIIIIISLFIMDLSIGDDRDGVFSVVSGIQ